MCGDSKNIFILSKERNQIIINIEDHDRKAGFNIREEKKKNLTISDTVTIILESFPLTRLP